MELVNMMTLLNEATDDHKAVAAINVSNMETIMGVMEASEKTGQSVIMQIAPVQLEAHGITYEQIVSMIKLFGKSYQIKTCIHLDHAMAIDDCFKAIDAGFTSVMYDGTLVDFETNMAHTKKVVDYAHGHGVTVEAELGKVGGSEASEDEDMGYKTRPEDVAVFVERTGVDCLAVAIGNAHGFYTLEPQLDFALLHAIKDVADIPLVLHGGTGIPVADIQQAIQIGIRKVNFFTEIDRAYVKGFVEAYEENKKIYMMHASEKARQAMMQEIINKIGWMRP